MKLPILRRYNKAVFYTYFAVVVLALVAASAAHNNKIKRLMAEEYARITQYSHQVEMLLESSARAMLSLRDLGNSHMQLTQSLRAPLPLEYQADGNRFSIFRGGIDNAEAVGLISGQGPLQQRSEAFYRELDTLYQMSLIFPVVERSSQTISQVYYISAAGMSSVFPWPQSNAQWPQNSPLLAKVQALPKDGNQVFWSKVYRNNQGKLVSTVGVPFYYQGQFLGGIFADVELAELANRIDRYFEVGGMVLMLDDDNMLLTYPRMHLDRSSTAFQLSQKLPAALIKEPTVELLNSAEGQLLQGYYVRSVAMEVAPWRLLFLQLEDELVAPAVEELESLFFTLILSLSILVSVVHVLTRRAFVSPAAKLIEHLKNSAERPQPLPAKVASGWEPWFELITRTFEDNQQYTRHLAEQNRRLDKLVAKRTERLRLANEQRERDFSLMRSLIDAIPEAIVFKDTNGRYMGCNKAAERMLGHSESEIIGCNLLDLENSPRAARLVQEDLQVLHRRTPDRFQEWRDVDGKMVRVDVLRLPFYNSRGELLGLISVWRDVTRDTEQQEQLRRSEQRYHLAMDAVEDGMWDWHLDSNQLICNPAYYTMLGYQPDEFPLLIETFYELMHADDRSRVEHEIDAYLATPSGQLNVEFRLRTKNGGYRWVLSRGGVVDFAEDGEPLRMLGTNKDITRQKENEVILLEAKQDAELANRTKSEFLANMSHEIRTPMNAVLGMLELALRTDVTPRQHDYLDKARMSATSLLRIINDILDFSKIEAGKLELEQRPFSLEQVLEHALSISSLKAQEKGIELLLYATFRSGLHIQGDSLRLGQVLVNLLSNAVKFTAEGEVELGCEDSDESNGRIRLKFWVRDTGIGISKAQQQRLFDAFSQADGSTTREYGGTGLGLSICKHLVAMMGGNIDIESELGVGTTFSFTIDAVVMPAPDQPEKALPTQIQGLRALVIDDNQTALQIYSTYLRDLGFAVDTAANGADGLQLAQQRAPQLVLLDWMMPEMDGVAVAEQLQQWYVSGKIERLPKIMMMTAYSAETVQQQLHSGRIDYLMQKPFKQMQLQDALLEVFAADFDLPAIEAAEEALAELTPEQGQRILLVEDNLINQQVATELLKSAGYHVTLAENGQIAVDLVAADNFDLILMDIQMPVMDGLQAAALIRASHPDLPIIAMTAHAMSGDRDKSLAAGMNDHITKPIVLPQLFETLKQWLKQP
ncbi:response regulator [Ferrimonas senticii]|uniref:response regulator n=1 Tax=Ferrimonas senticii TaxID=394566 RepID=UPI00040C9998|nr:response regulator [Ferrimonas senticii]